jgi:hypothetical protein
MMAKRLLTPEIKDGILEAFDLAGGVDYLVELAHRDPPTFCMLLGKIVPSEINAEITNSGAINLGDAMTEAEARAKKLAPQP